MSRPLHSQDQSFLRLLEAESPRLSALTVDDDLVEDRILGELSDFDKNFYLVQRDFAGNEDDAWVPPGVPQGYPLAICDSLPPFLSPTGVRTGGPSNQGSISRKSSRRTRLSSLVVYTQDPWCPVAAMNPNKYRDSNRESCWRPQKTPSDFRTHLIRSTKDGLGHGWIAPGSAKESLFCTESGQDPDTAISFCRRCLDVFQGRPPSDKHGLGRCPQSRNSDGAEQPVEALRKNILEALIKRDGRVSLSMESMDYIMETTGEVATKQMTETDLSSYGEASPKFARNAGCLPGPSLSDPGASAIGLVSAVISKLQNLHHVAEKVEGGSATTLVNGLLEAISELRSLTPGVGTIGQITPYHRQAGFTEAPPYVPSSAE